MEHEDKTQIESKGFIIADYSQKLIEKIEEEADQLLAGLDASSIYVLIDAMLGIHKPYVIVQDGDQLKVVYPSYIKVQHEQKSQSEQHLDRIPGYIVTDYTLEIQEQLDQIFETIKRSKLFAISQLSDLYIIKETKTNEGKKKIIYPSFIRLKS